MTPTTFLSLFCMQAICSLREGVVSPFPFNLDWLQWLYWSLKYRKNMFWKFQWQLLLGPLGIFTLGIFSLGEAGGHVRSPNNLSLPCLEKCRAHGVAPDNEPWGEQEQLRHTRPQRYQWKSHLGSALSSSVAPADAKWMTDELSSQDLPYSLPTKLQWKQNDWFKPLSFGLIFVIQ